MRPNPLLSIRVNPSASPAERLADMKRLVNGGLIPINFVGGFGSQHGQGANFLFCDGSVRFVYQGIDERVFRRLGHRADGEVIGSDQY